ncbi:hypothetical protein L5515_006775 [Caenorhabditis briggsae]|uniref:G-protein coupled receptors family 1 profile domain-containing protein n=1 Tax=Caenorhabditis briggsae TaxID=6238 RepID=A0AAE9F192_CAEBR|nr:hypothetical protein L5515_006775 [Caenorhabditis briggsae]
MALNMFNVSLGVVSTMTYFFLGNPGFLFIFANVSYILEILYTANTSSHFIVCLLMSSQYRRTVRNVLPCGRNLPADGRSSIPCVLFTFLTSMLVLEVKKANKNRSKLFSSSKDKESRNNTQLVLYFTLTFFVALFPLGVTSAIVDHIVEKVGFTVIGANFGSLLGVLYTANTSTHFVVCILISSLHQKTVKDAMLCGRNVVHTSTSMS